MCHKENSENMKRCSRKSKQVSWAPGVNLCQVKLFRSDDHPLKAGKPTQIHLRQNNSKVLPPTNGEDDYLPPGFGGSDHVFPQKKEAPHIPKIQWKCPPRFALSRNWYVVAGEESQETESQKLRDTKVLEAVYPRLSSIPQNPSVVVEVQHEYYNDSRTPTIRLTPIEEATAGVPTASSDLSNDHMNHLPVSSGALNPLQIDKIVLEPPSKKKPVVQALPDPAADLMAATTAALNGLMKTEEQRNLIDTELLAKIFSNPKMIEKLITDYAPANIGTNPAPSQTPTAVVSSIPSSVNLPYIRPDLQRPSKPVLSLDPAILSSPMPAPELGNHLQSKAQPAIARMSAQLDFPESVSKQVAAKFPMPRPSIGGLYSKHNQVQRTSNTTTALPNPSTKIMKLPDLVGPTLGTILPQSDYASQGSISYIKTDTPKDLDYFRSLIKEHGSENKQTWDLAHESGTKFWDPTVNDIPSMKFGEAKPRFQKQCMFFKRSKGCKKGENCQFLHDLQPRCPVSYVPELPVAKRMKMSAEAIKI